MSRFEVTEAIFWFIYLHNSQRYVIRWVRTVTQTEIFLVLTLQVATICVGVDAKMMPCRRLATSIQLFLSSILHWNHIG